MRYQTGFGNLALPPDERELKASTALFDQIVSDGPRRAADRLLGFVRSQGVPDAEFSIDGLRAVDRWLTTDARIEIEPSTSKTPLDTRLIPAWRDFTVDLLLLAGELAREFLRQPAWQLNNAAKKDTFRLLPGLIDASAGDDAPGLLSGPVYNGLIFHGRTQAGLMPPRTKSPLEKPIDRLLSLARDGSPTAQEVQLLRSRYAVEPPTWERPEIPPMPEASRAVCAREIHAGRAGSFGELIVFAPMSRDEAEELLEDENSEPDGSPPEEDLVNFVTELYRSWPHIEGDPDLTSVWARDLYDQIGPYSISAVSSREAPAGPLFESVVELATNTACRFTRPKATSGSVLSDKEAPSGRTKTMLRFAAGGSDGWVDSPRR